MIRSCILLGIPNITCVAFALDGSHLKKNKKLAYRYPLLKSHLVAKEEDPNCIRSSPANQ